MKKFSKNIKKGLPFFGMLCYNIYNNTDYIFFDRF